MLFETFGLKILGTHEPMTERFLKLRWNPTWKRQMLTHAVTGEECILEGDDWSLQYSGPTPFLARRSGESLWCNSRLKLQLTADPQMPNHWLVFSKAEGLQPLWPWRQQFQVLEVPIAISGHAQPLRTQVFKLMFPWHGAVLFWSLASLYKTVLGSRSMSPSQWYNKWWSWWLRRLEKCHVPSSHLRKASSRQDSEDPQPGLEVEERIFPQPAASSHAILLLVTQWASPSNKGGKDEMHRAAWASLLDGFLQIAFRLAPGSTMTVTCFAHPKVQCSPGGEWIGKHPFDVTFLPNAMVLVAALRKTPHTLLENALECLTSMEDRVALSAILVQLHSAGSKCLWLELQLIAHIAAMLDCHRPQESTRGPEQMGSHACRPSRRPGSLRANCAKDPSASKEVGNNQA